MLTEIQKEILKGKICPYCRQDTIFVDSEIIYGKSFGMIYLCKQCDAYVGVHKGTEIALGRLANKELRAWKKEAHKYFDLLWQKKVFGFTRNQAYEWLSMKLEIPLEYTHIGMFKVETCKKVIFYSKQLMIDENDVDRSFGVTPKNPHYETH